MRFFLFLAAALVAALNGQLYREGDSYKLANGFPNGAVITFFIRHKGHNDGPEYVGIDFYDQHDPRDEKRPDTAHIRMGIDWYQPVASNSILNGQWQTETLKEQPFDSVAPSNGYWKLDVIKLDSYRMNVFFQGFWSDVRTFKKSLDNIQFIHITEGFINFDHVVIDVRLPNNNIVPLSNDQFFQFIDEKNFNVARKLTTLPNFPIGSDIELIAMLRSSAGSGYKRIPTLYFVASGNQGDSFFMKIYQQWIATWHTFYLSLNWVNTHFLHIEGWEPKEESESCTLYETPPNGDLVHLLLTRKSKQTVVMTIRYKPQYSDAYGPNFLTCKELQIPEDKTEQMDRPFDIMSQDGALIFHIEQKAAKAA